MHLPQLPPPPSRRLTCRPARAPPHCRPLRAKVGVIDVRDSDFVGGHIKGAKNIGALPGRMLSKFSLQVAAQPVLPTLSELPPSCLAPTQLELTARYIHCCAVSETFNDDNQVDKVVEAHCRGADTVVVHCYLSQVRGPFCAQR